MVIHTQALTELQKAYREGRVVPNYPVPALRK